MTNNIAVWVPENLHALVRERDVAERWQRSLRTLQRWRSEGYGPPYLMLGGMVHYRVGDVLAFEAHVRRGGGE